MGVERLIYKMSHGHYGGYYVSVPEENFAKFKQSFPKQQFPRNVRTVNVNTEYTAQGKERFTKQYPRSKGIIRKVYFADRSKGTAHLDKILDWAQANEQNKWY